MQKQLKYITFILNNNKSVGNPNNFSNFFNNFFDRRLVFGCLLLNNFALILSLNFALAKISLVIQSFEEILTSFLEILL